MNVLGRVDGFRLLTPSRPAPPGACGLALRPVGAAPHANQQTVSQELVKLFTWVFIKISFFCCEKASLCCWSFLLSRVQLFAPPWTVARQAFLSFTVSWSLLKLMSIESVMPSNYLVLCCPLLLLPSIFLSIRVFSSELALCIRWLKY